jgi:hypothetical protein
MSNRALLVALAAPVLVLGLALVLAPQAWADEARNALIEWDPTTSHIMVKKEVQMGSLPRLIVQHLSHANTDDDSQNGLDDGAQIAADGPLGSYSLVIDIDNTDTNILSPPANIGEFALPLTNTITRHSDFAEITTVQQSSGLANATSNLVLLVNASLLDDLIEELFSPHETLLETTATSFVGNTGHNGGPVGEDEDSIATAGGQKIVEGAVASSTSASTLTSVLGVIDKEAVFVEIRKKITSVESPHGNVIDATAANNLVELNNLFLGTTTLQQQAGGANVQQNLLIQGSNGEITILLHD